MIVLVVSIFFFYKAIAFVHSLLLNNIVFVHPLQLEEKLLKLTVRNAES